MDYSPQQVVAGIFDAIEAMDNAQNELEEQLNLEVDSLELRIKAEAAAWRKVEGSNREQREAFVKETCVAEIIAHERAKAKAKALMEKVRGKRQALSSYQTASKSVDEESQHSRMGPDMPLERKGQSGTYS